MRFSNTTKCFYPEGFNYADLPADIIEAPQEDFDAAMARNPGDTLDVIEGRVVVVPKPAPSRDEQIATVWHSIKTKRDQVKYGGVKVGDKWFHSDDGSRIQQMGLVMMGANLPAGLQWKTMDGSFITMTPALAQQILTGQAASDQAIFAVAEQHRVAMEASPDPAAYDFSTNWPKIFGE